MRKIQLVLPFFIFLFLFLSTNALAYNNYLSAYDRDFTTNASQNALAYSYQGNTSCFNQSWTGGNITFGSDVSGIVMFNNSCGNIPHQFFISMPTNFIVNSSGRSSVFGFEFALNNVSGLPSSSAVKVYDSSLNLLGYTNISISNNTWTSVPVALNVPSGTMVNVILDFDNWTIPADLVIYINRMTAGSVETDEIWNSIPSDSYLYGLCDDSTSSSTPYQDCKDTTLSSLTATNKSGGNLVTYFKYASDYNTPCIITYYNKTLSVRTSINNTGTFNGWHYSYNYTGGLGPSCYFVCYNSLSIFTTDYFFDSWGQNGGCLTPYERADMINYGGTTYFIGTGFDGGCTGTVAFSITGSVAMSALCTLFDNYYKGTANITNYNMTGSTFTLSGYTFTVPFSLTSICTPNWFCNSNQEYYLTSECGTVNQTSCGMCGCGSDRCAIYSYYNHTYCDSTDTSYKKYINKLFTTGCSYATTQGQCGDNEQCINHNDTNSIECFNTQTGNHDSCIDATGNNVICTSSVTSQMLCQVNGIWLSCPSLFSNPMGTFALYIGGLFGTKDLVISENITSILFSFIIAFILMISIAIYSKKNVDSKGLGEIFMGTMLVFLIMFTLVTDNTTGTSWFPAWIIITMIATVAIILSGALGKIIGGGH